MAIAAKERGRRGGAAQKGRPKVPRSLLDLRHVWKRGVQEGEREEALLKTLKPQQQTLYRLLKDDPKGFQKVLREEEASYGKIWRAAVEAKKAQLAEKAGGVGVAGATIPAEGQHQKVEDLIGGLVSQWEQQHEGRHGAGSGPSASG